MQPRNLSFSGMTCNLSGDFFGRRLCQYKASVFRNERRQRRLVEKDRDNSEGIIIYAAAEVRANFCSYPLRCARTS